jgi:hypothetical protein
MNYPSNGVDGAPDEAAARCYQTERITQLKACCSSPSFRIASRTVRPCRAEILLWLTDRAARIN